MSDSSTNGRHRHPPGGGEQRHGVIDDMMREACRRQLHSWPLWTAEKLMEDLRRDYTAVDKVHLEEVARLVVEMPTDELKEHAGIDSELIDRADPRHVLATWRREGPLVHELTGIPWLDENTGGGPVYGSRWYLLGAPDAGKTALSVQIADEFARRGVTVGILGVDEEPGDLLMRFAQRRGVSRGRCERRDPYDLDIIEEQLEGLPLWFYTGDMSIESAATDLRGRAGGGRALLVIDSLQTAQSGAEDPKWSRHEAINARVGAIRTAASHGLFVLATSEMGRAFYRTAAHDLDALAAGKESGAIEYSGRVVLALTSVPGESDLVELKLVKNKHGNRTRADEKGHHLRLDRARQEFAPATDYNPESIEERRAERSRAQIVEDAALVALVVATQPGLASGDLRDAVRARARESGGTIANPRIGEAVAFLRQANALVIVKGNGCAKPHYLDGEKLPEEVTNAIEKARRPAVLRARPPVEHLAR